MIYLSSRVLSHRLDAKRSLFARMERQDNFYIRRSWFSKLKHRGLNWYPRIQYAIHSDFFRGANIVHYLDPNTINTHSLSPVVKPIKLDYCAVSEFAIVKNYPDGRDLMVQHLFENP